MLSTLQALTPSTIRLLLYILIAAFLSAQFAPLTTLFSDEMTVLCALEFELEEDGKEAEKEGKKKELEDSLLADPSDHASNMSAAEGFSLGMKKIRRLHHFQDVPTPPPEG